MQSFPILPSESGDEEKLDAVMQSRGDNHSKQTKIQFLLHNKDFWFIFFVFYIYVVLFIF